MATRIRRLLNYNESVMGMNLDNKSMTMILMAIGGFSLLGLVFSGSLLFAFLGVLCFVFGLAVLRYGHVLVPVLLQHRNVVERINEHVVPPSNDVITKENNGVHYASVFLQAQVVDSVSDKTSEQKQLLSEYFERAVSNLGFVCKYSFMIVAKDIQKYREKILTRRGIAELRLSKLKGQNLDGANEMIARKYEREIQLWTKQLSRLTTGEKPLEAVCYIMTTASGLTNEEAIVRARRQADQIVSTVSNALNVEIKQLKGNDMKKCFEWEYALPTTLQELEASAW